MAFCNTRFDTCLNLNLNLFQGDARPPPVRHPPLQDHRHGQLHAAAGRWRGGRGGGGLGIIEKKRRPTFSHITEWCNNSAIFEASRCDVFAYVGV